MRGSWEPAESQSGFGGKITNVHAQRAVDHYFVGLLCLARIQRRLGPGDRRTQVKKGLGRFALHLAFYRPRFPDRRAAQCPSPYLALCLESSTP
jgi:hypothetical protein